jgi:sterol O-acyltransferase
MVWNGIGGFQLAVAFLIVILVCALLVYPGLKLWIWTRDYSISVIIFLTIYVLYLLTLLIGFTYSIILSDIGIYLKFILGVLLVFQMMKIHSFVRSNATKNSKDAPKVQAFLYFLQAPTLIYCDEYPRTEKIRWTFVLRSALESVAYLAFMTTSVISLALDYQDVQDASRVSVTNLFVKFTANYYYGFLIVFSLYMVGFPSVLNLVAELTRFADRQFYTDWWNVGCFKGFVRKSNHLVQNFTNKFLYQDLKKYFSKEFSKLLTFFISGIFHDVLGLIAFGYFLPYITIIMTVHGFYVSYVCNNDRTYSKYVFWFFYLAWNTGTIHIFALEYFARSNKSCTNIFEICILRLNFEF